MSISDEEKAALFQEFRAELLKEMFALTKEKSHPMANPMAERFRNLPALQWNTKVYGAELAAKHYATSGWSRPATLNDQFQPRWCATRFEDYLQKWFVDTCHELQISALLHRKIWEEAYIVNVLKSAGKLKPGMRGIAFGVGQERLPSYFASLGVNILGTDLSPDNDAASGWMATAQHGSLDRLFYSNYLGRTEFDQRVSFAYADMNNISDEWDGQFDFCWSTCAFEHLGSIELGLAFVENTGRLLKPGGVSVHTTEFNFSSDEETIDNWPTVLFRKRDFESLASRLREKGYSVPEVSFDVGSTPVDMFVDLPPYRQHNNYYFKEFSALHLKLMVDGFPATCYGLNFSK